MNKHARALGRLAKGKPKNFTKAERKRLAGPIREPYIADDRVETLTYCGLGQMRRLVFRRDGKGLLTMADGSVTTATALCAQLRKWMAVKPRRME